MSVCTGVNQQYADTAGCMKACSFMSAGTPVDQGTNTVGCRLNAAGSANTDTRAIKTACWAAGPLSYGHCGNDCDLFCTVALGYCSTAAGYDGLPPYASMDECETACSQYNRVIDFGVPGAYGATYTPGSTADTTDTLECRAAQLFIGALRGGGDQALHCATAGSVSSTCGNGPSPATLDGGAPLGPPPAYDGGLVNAINASTWDETKYPPAKRKMLLRDEGDPHLVMVDLSKTPILQWKTATGGPGARAAQLIGANQILGGRSDGYGGGVFDYTTGAIVKTVEGFANTQSVYRTVTGETMLTRSGTVLTFLDGNDKPSHEIVYPGFPTARLARPTRNGTYLVPSDTVLFEGDRSGNILWKLDQPRLERDLGAAALQERRRARLHGLRGLVRRRRSNDAPPDQALRHEADAPGGDAAPELLRGARDPSQRQHHHHPPASWQGEGTGNGASGIQVLEFEPSGNLVWFWKQDSQEVFSSDPGRSRSCWTARPPAYLHVQETSPDGSWQPVIPSGLASAGPVSATGEP